MMKNIYINELTVPFTLKIAVCPAVHRWYKGSSEISESEAQRGRRIVMNGGILVISALKLTDKGEYRCVVNNSLGSISLVTVVTVTSPIKVQVRLDYFHDIYDSLRKFLC